jgi:hypothetical protein
VKYLGEAASYMNKVSIKPIQADLGVTKQNTYTEMLAKVKKGKATTRDLFELIDIGKFIEKIMM